MRNDFIVPIGLMVGSDSHGSLGTDQSRKTEGFCRRICDTVWRKKVAFKHCSTV